MLRFITGRRRTRVLVVMSLLWSVSWVVLGLTGLVPGSAAAVAGVLVFHSLFALGETMFQPTIPAITNDLAPDHLRGRYNAVNAGAFQGGTIAGPIVAGVLLERGLDTAYIATIAGGCLAMILLALRVERLISPAVNGVGPAASEPEVPDVTVPGRATAP